MNRTAFQSAVDAAAAHKWNGLSGVTRADLDEHAERVGVRLEVVDSAGKRWQVLSIDGGYSLRPTSQWKVVSVQPARRAVCRVCAINEPIRGSTVCASCT